MLTKLNQIDDETLRHVMNLINLNTYAKTVTANTLLKYLVENENKHTLHHNLELTFLSRIDDSQ